MTQEEKQLLLIDLSARLPYGVIVDNPSPAGGAWDEVINIDTSEKTVTLLYNGRVFSIDYVKPYLRPMSSMTEEEINEFILISDTALWLGNKRTTCILSLKQMDWLNERSFDYRGLIPIGLALEAHEGMYKAE